MAYRREALALIEHYRGLRQQASATGGNTTERRGIDLDRPFDADVRYMHHVMGTFR